MLYRLRQRRMQWFALLALVMHLLLPFVHASQMLAMSGDGVAAMHCHMVGMSQPMASSGGAHDGHDDSSMAQCPVCMAIGGLHVWSLPSVPVVPQLLAISFALPVPVPHGSTHPAPDFLLPLSHAPPA